MPAPLLLSVPDFCCRGVPASDAALSGATDALKSHAQGASTRLRVIDRATDSARRSCHDAQDYARQGVESAGAGRSHRDFDQGPGHGGGRRREFRIRDMADKVIGQATISRSRPARRSDTWDQNPLLVAAIGLGSAALSPRLFPRPKPKKRCLATQAMRCAVRPKASPPRRRSGRNPQSKAWRQRRAAQGLSLDGLAKFGESLTGKVRAVAERGVEAALGDTKKQAQAGRDQIDTG